uniref:Uncharacterized protein n=1 Tax=Candidatus Kentrum sp. UNK TaxID=2126344 RepID=A0A451AW04_9GAMM|nr:MAG: hypothetical protein BECKUNK1418G_GA0071005_107018 [Candidatus Kentron sp. UNK]VFK70240.1 MAG: hypothetical protein BECKUNK1418H_GA0071006_102518 [Candidatus Kentron sp. UNK]
MRKEPLKLDPFVKLKRKINKLIAEINVNPRPIMPVFSCSLCSALPRIHDPSYPSESILLGENVLALRAKAKRGISLVRAKHPKIFIFPTP